MLIHRARAQAFGPPTRAVVGDLRAEGPYKEPHAWQVATGWEEYLASEGDKGPLASAESYVECKACRRDPVARKAALRTGKQACSKRPACAPILQQALQLDPRAMEPESAGLSQHPAFAWCPRFKEVFAGSARVTQALKAM